MAADCGWVWWWERWREAGRDRERAEERVGREARWEMHGSNNWNAILVSIADVLIA